MDNLPPELQYRLINLKFCIQNQSPEQALSALDELTSMLSTHYQCFQKAHEALEQLHSSTQTRQTNLSTSCSVLYAEETSARAVRFFK